MFVCPTHRQQQCFFSKALQQQCYFWSGSMARGHVGPSTAGVLSLPQWGASWELHGAERCTEQSMWAAAGTVSESPGMQAVLCSHGRQIGDLHHTASANLCALPVEAAHSPVPLPARDCGPQCKQNLHLANYEHSRHAGHRNSSKPYLRTDV